VFANIIMYADGNFR